MAAGRAAPEVRRPKLLTFYKLTSITYSGGEAGGAFTAETRKQLLAPLKLLKTLKMAMGASCYELA